MSTTAERVTKIPSLCKHCNKHTSNPPRWVDVLALMAGGKGIDVYLTSTQLSQKLRCSRQAAYNLIQAALKEGALQPISEGSNTYRKTKYGVEIHSRWVRSGWKSEVKKR